MGHIEMMDDVETARQSIKQIPTGRRSIGKPLDTWNKQKKLLQPWNRELER